MTGFNEAIQTLLQSDIPTSFKQFGAEIDARYVEQALAETGTASIRRKYLEAPTR